MSTSRNGWTPDLDPVAITVAVRIAVNSTERVTP